MTKITLKYGREKSVLNQHPWLFSGAIEDIAGSPQNGEIVDVYSAQNKLLGRGFYNNKTNIAIRFLTFSDEPINKDFWYKRLTQAIKFRETIINAKNTNAYRLIHGEGDFLPGLVLDKYGDHLVIQITSWGMEKEKDVLVKILKELLKPASIYERGDIFSRRIEGLEQKSGQLFSERPDQVEILENGLKFLVDLKKGQKTGFFLDQRDNRAKVGALAKNKNVLNCFCYTGGFSVYAAAQGAKSTLSIDLSEEAVNLVQQNIKLNNLNLENNLAEKSDVFDRLRSLKQENKNFDLIVLDPPAFTKNADSVKKAARGYKDINMIAMQLLTENGILVTCSCSQHIDKMLFQKIVHDAAVDAKRNVQLIEQRGQAGDHPVSLAHPEGDYLKCLICRVL